MNSVLTWKKGVFSCTYNLMAGDIHVGALKDKAFSFSSIGSIEDSRYKFQMRGHLNPKTEIIDMETNALIGEIKYSCWHRSAKIQLGDRLLHWKFNTIWENKWSLYDEDGTQLDFSGCSTKGSVSMNEHDGLMVLIGLYISNYYWQLATVLMAVIFPIVFLF